MAICPSCGGYMPRNNIRGICRDCQMIREIESLRNQIGEIYRKLPLQVRASLRDQDQVYVRRVNLNVSGVNSSRRSKRLCLERDALRKQYAVYRKAAIESGIF